MNTWNYRTYGTTDFGYNLHVVESLVKHITMILKINSIKKAIKCAQESVLLLMKMVISSLIKY